MRVRVLWLLSVVLVATVAVAEVRPQNTNDVSITADVVYGHKDGMALTFDVFQPPRPNGAAVAFMVSGGWFSRWQDPDEALPRFRPLLDRGFTVFAVRHGSSPRYVLPEIVPDVRRALRFIRMTASTYGVDPDRIGVWGGSAGGHLSLVLGTSPDGADPAADDPVLRHGNRVAAVVAYYPPVDLRPLARGVVPERPSERFPALHFDPADAPAISPILHVSADDPPTLLIHGDEDDLVPISNSERMHVALTAQGVTAEFVTIPGAGHGFRDADAEKATQLMVAWFERHLGRQAAPSSDVQEGAWHHVHPVVTDTREAAAWYGRHLGADRVAVTASFDTALFGDALVRFRRGSARSRSPVSSIDHVGFSVRDLDAKMKELETAGARILSQPREFRGVKVAFVEDPWGVKIEVMQDPDLLGFHHLHLQAADPDVILRWYADTFGGVVARYRDAVPAVRYRADSETKGAGGEMWLMVSPVPAAGLTASTVPIDHVSWSFKGPTAFDRAVARIKEKGIKVTTGPQISVGDWGNRVMFIEDPGGVRIEVTELLEK